MARVVMQAVVSVDGYIAYPDDTVGPPPPAPASGPSALVSGRPVPSPRVQLPRAAADAAQR